MNPNLSKRITMSSIRVWPDLANMLGVDAAPTPKAPNGEEEELEEPQMSACFAEGDDAFEGSPAEMAEKAMGSADQPPAETGTEAMEAEAAEAAEIPAGSSEAGVEGEKDDLVVPPSVGTASSEDVRQGSSSEVPLGQPQPASEETPEEQATEAPEAEGIGEAPMTAMEVEVVEADKEADKEEEVAMEVEEKDEEEWVNIPGAPQELTPAMPSDAEEEPEESIDDTLQLMLEISEQEPGSKQHVFADSVAEKPPMEDLPEEPEPKAEAPTEPERAQLDAPQSQAEVRSPARTPERKESPAPTVKPKSPGQSGAKRGRNEANPFYPALRPSPVASSPSMVPRPPKRVKLPAVVMPHGKTQAPGTLLLRAVALVLEELFRQLQPSLVRQVPKIMERNRFTEIALLHQVLEKYVAPLPLLPEGDGSPSQIDLLQVILEKLPKGLGVPCGLLRGRTPVLPEVAEEAVTDFLRRLYALINSAQNQEASPVPLPPEAPRASRKAPKEPVDSQDSEDREAGAERRLSNRILHGDTLLSREQVERRIAWKRHYAMLEKMAQAAPPEPTEAPAAPAAPAVPSASAPPAASAARAARSSWGLQRQQIEMFE